MHDPVEGVWWDLQVKEAPAWAVSGARKGKDLHKGGNRRSHRPTSREMEGIREGGPSGGNAAYPPNASWERCSGKWSLRGCAAGGGSL